MKKRRRIAIAENLIREVIRRPQLAPAGQTISLPGLVRERSLGQPLVELGPIVVRASATVTGRAVVEAHGTSYAITVPDTPERQAAAFGMATGGLMLGGWIAELVTDDLGSIIISALAGSWGGARLWNRWVRERDRWARSRAQ